jgi:ATP-dependent Clp protease, protease subunit
MIEIVTIDPRIKVRAAKDLIWQPRVHRVTELSEASVKPLADYVSEAHDARLPVIPIVIDTLGGDPYALFAMADILASCQVPIATIILGKGMSAGAALFCCGTSGWRYIAPHALLMIHDVTSEEVSGKPHEMKADAEETDRLNKLMYEFMERKIGKRQGYLLKHAQKRGHADWYITPEEAVKHGIANHIKVPTFTTNVTVETTLA